MYIDLISVGKRIKKKRMESCWSIEDLAELSNYSAQHIGNIERGQAKPSIEALVAIAHALKTSPDKLLDFKTTVAREFIADDIAKILHKASDSQLKVIADTLETLIESWNKTEDN